MSVVLIDVDGTLLPSPSSERRFLAHLMRIGKLGPVQLGGALAFYLRWSPRFGRDTGRKNKAWLANLKTADVAALAERFVADDLRPRLRPSMLDRIAQHRRQGQPIALLTGTPEFIAEPLAALVGADTFVATRCRTRGERFCAAPPLQHPLGVDKVHLARTLCRELGGHLSEATAYADSSHDRALLERVARPVAVAPDRRLLRVARMRGWEILDGPAAWRVLDAPD